MPSSARKSPSYEDLCKLPDHLIGEIVNGELVATPRPSPAHGNVSSSLGIVIGGPYKFGFGGGPGGWWILDEPELKLGEHVLVPDLAGWRRERLPALPKENWFSVPPDWVCEVLSPATVRLDRIKKAPVYASFGIPHLWLVDPLARSLEVLKLTGSHWALLAAHSEDERVRCEPFQEIEIDLALLWA